MPGHAKYFSNLSTLALCLSKIENFNDMLLVLEDITSQRLEHLHLHQDLARSQPHTLISRNPPNRDALSLGRKLYHSPNSVVLPQHGLAIRFVDIRSEDPTFARIYFLDIPHTCPFSPPPASGSGLHSFSAPFIRSDNTPRPPRNGMPMAHISPPLQRCCTSLKIPSI